MLSLIVAASTNNAIGLNGQLPWKLPNDMKFFKDTTWGMVVIMGRKTFESLGKPLPGRVNIAITRNGDWKADGVLPAKDINDAIEQAATTNCKEVFVIGGGEVYRQSLSIADRIYMTRVHAIIEGDTFFPEIDERLWELKENVDFATDEKHAVSYSFQIWDRKK